jgi:N-acetylmuramoyl-L-alanine amidase
MQLNKDVLYTARWHSKEIEKATTLERAKKVARALTDFLTNFIEGAKPDAVKEPKGSKVRLALVVGHEKDRPGALLHGGGHEYQYNSKVAQRAQAFAKEVLFDELEVFVVYRDGIGISGAYEKVADLDPDAVIELHFNAFNKRVVGTELLYHDDKDKEPQVERAFAEHVLSGLYQLFRPNAPKESKVLRGAKDLPRGHRGWYNVSRVLDFPSILVEPFFGDTPSDAKLARELLDDYAKELCALTLEFFENDK